MECVNDEYFKHLSCVTEFSRDMKDKLFPKVWNKKKLFFLPGKEKIHKNAYQNGSKKVLKMSNMPKKNIALFQKIQIISRINKTSNNLKVRATCDKI